MSSRATPQLIEARRRSASDDYDAVLDRMAQRFVASMKARDATYEADAATILRLKEDLDEMLAASSSQ